MFEAWEGSQDQCIAKSTASDLLQGTWTFQTYGSVTLFNRAGEIYSGHLGFGYYALDGVSINLEAAGHHFNASEGFGNNADMGGLDLLIRWHLIDEEPLSVYVEGGAGILQGSNEVPPEGTRFNFSPQFGCGVTWLFAPGSRLMAGARWQHISNAAMHGEIKNPGYDGLMVYSGLVFSF